MIEFNQSSFAVLKRRVSAYGDRANPMPGDVNEILPSLLRNDLHPRAPCFCLLDPEGTELNWSTVKSVATTLRRRLMPELLILFPSAELLRLLPKAGVVDPKHESILDRMLPSKRWRDIYAQRLSGSITPSDAKEQYVEHYRDGLERLGYKAFSHIVAAPDLPGGTRRERYRLIFATQHPAGEAIMLDVFKRPYVLDYPVSAQLPMLD